MKEHLRQKRKLSPGELLQLRALERNNDPRRLPASWRYLSQTYRTLLPEKAGRNDIGVFVKPGAGRAIGAHGYFSEEMARIVIDGELLPCDPGELDPRHNSEHFKAMSVFHGVFIHEAGHAAHTRHLNEPREGYSAGVVEVDGVAIQGKAAMYCASQLEEIRMEAQVVREHPDDVRWLRAAMRKLHADTMTGQLEFAQALDKLGFKADKNLQVGIASIYTIGRVHAGVLTEDDVKRFSEKLDEILGPEARSELDEILAEAVKIEDVDQDDLVRLGERMAALFTPVCDCQCHRKSSQKSEGQGDGKPQHGDKDGTKHESAEGQDGEGSGSKAEGEDEQNDGEGQDAAPGSGEDSGDGHDGACPNCGCGGHGHGQESSFGKSATGTGKDSESDGGLTDEEAEELMDAAAEALSEAAREQLEQMGEDDPARKELEDLADKNKAKEKIEEAQRAVGRRLPGSPSGAQPERGEREPTPKEKTARVLLSRKLREVRWRERTRVKSNNVLPPGRMRGRELIRERVDRSRGMPSQAQPWKRKRSQHVELPVVTCGVLIDTSGSMGGAEGLLSSALWVIANAIADNGGRTGGYAFGNAVEPVLPPEAPPRFVTAFKTGGGTAGVPKTLEFAEKDLHWEDAYGPRLLVICSDGAWGDAASTADALSRVKQKGIKVILCGINYPATDHGMPELFDQQVVVKNEHELAKVIGDAAIKELRNF